MLDYNKQIEMTIDRVDRIVDVLKKSGKMRRVDLINRIENKGTMSHATAAKAIEEGVTQNKIIRTVEKASSGKQDMVFLTVYSQIAENEKYTFDKMKKMLENFDTWLSLFKKKYSSLSKKEKAIGAERFNQLDIQLILTGESLSMMYGNTKKWADLLSNARTTYDSLNNLLTSLSKKERGQVTDLIRERRFLYLGETIKDLDEYLKKHQII